MSSETDEGDPLNHPRYGHHNDHPHMHVDLTFAAWDEVVLGVLDYKHGPAIAWHYEGGTLFLWGERLDESMKWEIIDDVEDYEQELARDGFYEAAQNAERAAEHLARAEVYPADEMQVT